MYVCISAVRGFSDEIGLLGRCIQHTYVNIQLTHTYIRMYVYVVRMYVCVVRGRSICMIVWWGYKENWCI